MCWSMEEVRVYSDHLCTVTLHLAIVMTMLEVMVWQSTPGTIN